MKKLSILLTALFLIAVSIPEACLAESWEPLEMPEEERVLAVEDLLTHGHPVLYFSPLRSFVLIVEGHEETFQEQFPKDDLWDQDVYWFVDSVAAADAIVVTEKMPTDVQVFEFSSCLGDGYFCAEFESPEFDLGCNIRFGEGERTRCFFDPKGGRCVEELGFFNCQCLYSTPNDVMPFDFSYFDQFQCTFLGGG